MALAIAITLGSLRLLGGLLKLKVGYKVGGLIVVMGWLVHGGDIPIWITIRLFWTAFGVILTVLALQLFWPMRSGVEVFKHYANLLVGIKACNKTCANRRKAIDRRSAQLITNNCATNSSACVMSCRVLPKNSAKTKAAPASC